jgi:hypothetical protein
LRLNPGKSQTWFEGNDHRSFNPLPPGQSQTWFEGNETPDDGLPFTVDEQVDLAKAAHKISIIGSSQQKLENSVN